MKEEIILNSEEVKAIKAELRDTYIKMHGSEPTERWLTNSIKAMLNIIVK